MPQLIINSFPSEISSDKIKLALFSINGRKIYSDMAIKAGELIKISIQGLKSGEYFISIITNGKTIVSSSFVKIK